MKQILHRLSYHGITNVNYSSNINVGHARLRYKVTRTFSEICQILETEIKVSLLIRAPDFHSPASVAQPHCRNGSYYCSWTGTTTSICGLQQPTSFLDVSF